MPGGGGGAGGWWVVTMGLVAGPRMGVFGGDLDN